MMSTLQGDTMASGIPALAAETAVQGFPDGWTARTAINGTWTVDPGAWIDTVVVGSGLAEKMLAEPASVEVSVTNVSFNLSTGMVTATVNAKVDSALSGDFRFSLYMIEDSVTGTGAGYDQHNYYYHNASYPLSPYYNLGNAYYINNGGTVELDGSTIPGWEHMQVFRYSAGPVWGTDGVIPSKVPHPVPLSQITYSFPMPANVVNPNQVSLIGFVSKYSATSLAGNQILDAEQVKLTNTPIVSAPNNISITSAQSSYMYGTHAGGDTSAVLTVQNSGSASVAVGLSVSQSELPAGWSVNFSPSPVTVAGGASQPVTMTITAPEQSAFIEPTISINPTEAGFYIQASSTSFAALSDNTQYPILYDPSEYTGDETITSTSLPDSMKLHSAVIPMIAATLAAYPPENYPVSIYDNFLFLDNGGAYSNAGPLLDIENSLASGEKVFVSSDAAMSFAFDPNTSQFPPQLQTDAVQSFYQYLGLDFTTTEDRYNTSSGVAISYSIRGETGDSIGNGISVTNAGGDVDGENVYNAIYTIDSNSIPVFYSGTSSTKDVIGSRFQDPVTGGKIVYLGFDLAGITSQTEAGTIYSKSIDWLLAPEAPAAPSSVAPVATTATSITASPNPFHGVTEINYIASQDEQNVTFAVYDVLGRQVATLPAQNSGSSYIATFDGSDLANGTYVILAHSSKGTSQVRVVNQ